MYSAPVRVSPPLLPPLEKRDISSLEEEVEGYLIEGGTISKRQRFQVEDSHFKRVVFEKIDGEGSSFVRVIFDSCDLSNAKLGSSSIHQILFKNCKLIGTDFSASSLQNVIFDTCDLSYSNFSFSKMRSVQIEDSKLVGSSFNEVKMQKILLIESNFRECEFLHTPLKGIDLSGCLLEGIKTRFEDIRGAIVDEQGALALASLLDIKIK